MSKTACQDPIVVKEGISYIPIVFTRGYRAL